MKLKFKDYMLVRYSFKDLEYALVILNAQLGGIEDKMNTLLQDGADKFYVAREIRNQQTPILEKIAIVENEIGDRMLTGNDDGTLERELLGVNQ